MAKKKKLKWRKLENAAKIFPSTSNKIDTKVFRFVCELYENVDAVSLKKALDKTLKQFPLYHSVLKRGLFWYYLEETKTEPVVKVEQQSPCCQIYKQDGRTLLFRVTYYHQRINLEVYHALTDGTGALNFLRTLVFHYIVIAHKEDFPKEMYFPDYDASHSQKAEDSFAKYYSGKEDMPTSKITKAHQIRGERFEDYRLGVIGGRMSVKEVIKKAHEYGGTVTSFIVAVMMNAAGEYMSIREKRKPVVVSVPVNLRQFFPSKSARNFFGVVELGYQFEAEENKKTDLKKIIEHNNASLKENLTADQMEKRINQLLAWESRLLARVLPLFIKNKVLQIINVIKNQKVTMALSNLGKVEMPAEVLPYIRLFDVFISTRRVQACMCSFGDELMISFTSSFVDTDIQRNFFRTLTEMGIEVEITTNIPEDKEDLK